MSSRSGGEAHADEHVLREDGEVVRLRQDRDERGRDDDGGHREHEAEARDAEASRAAEREWGAEEGSPFFRSSSDAASSSESAVRSPVTAAR